MSSASPYLCGIIRQFIMGFIFYFILFMSIFSDFLAIIVKIHLCELPVQLNFFASNIRAQK